MFGVTAMLIDGEVSKRFIRNLVKLRASTVRMANSVTNSKNIMQNLNYYQ